MESPIHPKRPLMTSSRSPFRRRWAAGAILFGVFGAVAAGPSPGFAQAPALPLPTPAEVAEYLGFTGAEEVAPYLQRVARAADGIEAGSLPGAEGIPVIRIGPLTDAGSPGQRVGDGSAPVVRVLIIGAQHGDERAGLEVGLRVARDLAAGPLAGLRGRLDVRIVPMANPGGVRARDRLTPAGIDMNRDHIRLADPATRALWAEFTAWRPHLVLDLHEIGPSEYSIQVAVPTHPNVDPGLAVFGRFYMLPHTAKALARADVRYHEYVAPWFEGSTTEIAAEPADSANAAVSWYTPPPTEASSARNAFGLAGSLAFLVEAASSRDVLGLEERTERMYVAAAALLTVAAELASDLVAAADRAAAVPGDSLVIRSRYAERLPGARLPWVFVNDRGQQEQGHLAPWRSELRIDARLSSPAGWWVVGDSADLLAALEGHGFRAAEVGAAAPAPARWLEYPRCGDVTVSWPPLPRPLGEAERAGREQRGRWLPADQPGARLLFTIVEPGSEGGWFEDAAGLCAGSGEAQADSVFPVLRLER